MQLLGSHHARSEYVRSKHTRLRKTNFDRLRRALSIKIFCEHIGELETSQCVGVEWPVVPVHAPLSYGVNDIPGFFFVETKARGTDKELEFHPLTLSATVVIPEAAERRKIVPPFRHAKNRERRMLGDEWQSNQITNLAFMRCPPEA
jgi:hypothetical protein